MKRIVGFLLILLLSASSTFIQAQQPPLRVLAIGNSFSDDGVEYLDELAEAAGIPIIVGNLYIGGCSLETHWENAVTDSARYEYRKSDLGTFTNRPNTSLSYGVRDEAWDYITMQQASHFSGLPATYFPYLTDLIGYVNKNARNPQVKLAFHQTWAYAQDSDHGGFTSYDRDQMTMYRAIVEAVDGAMKQSGLTLIIPAGTAIQNGRTSSIGDNFCRDGYHLDEGIGRYTAACVWFEVLCGRSVIGNPFRPQGVTDAQADIAQRAAHTAVQNRTTITTIQ